MATATLQQLGLSPIEGSVAQGSYLEFWPEQYLPVVDQLVPLSPKTKDRIMVVSRYVSEMSEFVLDDHPCEEDDEVDETRIGRNNSTVKRVIGLDDCLGSLNVMHGGQDMLLAAASKLLCSNDLTQSDSSSKTPAAGRNPYKKFTAEWRQTDMQSQKPGAVLLRAAELVHKAGWIDDNEDRRARLFDIATELYDRITASDEIHAHGKRQAENLRTDIVYHGLSTAIRAAHAKGNTAQRDTLAARMRTLVEQDAHGFQKRYHRRSASSTGQAAESHGMALEDVSVLALRDTIANDGMYDTEVRHAFTSEDTGVSGIYPKSSFDIVAQHYDGETVTALPVQLKYLSGAPRPKSYHATSQEDYLPGIAYVTVSGVSSAQISTAAAALANRSTAINQRARPFKSLETQLGPLLEG